MPKSNYKMTKTTARKKKKPKKKKNSRGQIMATWPSSNKPVTTTTDADSDSISGARADINKAITNQIEIIDMFNIPGSPTDNYILKYNASANRFDMEADSGGTITGVTNFADNRVVTASGATTLNGEAGMTFDGSNAVISGSAGGLTSPVLEIETDNSGYDKPQLMFKDSNADVWSMAGRNNTGAGLYQAGFTFDPNNTHGRTGVTSFAGDYFIGFNKNYSDQSAISMDMAIFGANDGFNISAFDDFNSGGGNQYGYKPINLKGNEINLMPGGTTVMTVASSGVTIGEDLVIGAAGENDVLHINTNLQLTENAITASPSGSDPFEIKSSKGLRFHVDSNNSGNEAMEFQSGSTTFMTIQEGPGGDAELTVKGDGFFIKDDNDDVQFSMDMSAAGQTGINVFRTNENKILAFSLKTDDDDDTGNYDGTWSFRQNADEKALILERVDGSAVEIFEIRDSADVATADPVDIFEFKIPPVLPSFTVANLPTTVVAGAQAFCTNDTGGAVNVFYDGSAWRRCTDRAVAST